MFTRQLNGEELKRIAQENTCSTCAVTSSPFAHDNVTGLVVDDYTDADEGTLRLRHDVVNVLFLKSSRSFWRLVKE
jgi:hypothetical protein